MPTDQRKPLHKAEDPLEEIASILALGIKRRRARLAKQLTEFSQNSDTKLH